MKNVVGSVAANDLVSVIIAGNYGIISPECNGSDGMSRNRRNDMAMVNFRVQAVIPFNLYLGNRNFTGIQDSEAHWMRVIRALNVARSKVGKGRRVRFRLIDGRDIGISSFLQRRKRYFIWSGWVDCPRSTDCSIDHREGLFYYDYGLGCVICDFKLALPADDCFAEAYWELHNSIISAKEQSNFFFQKLMVSAHNLIPRGDAGYNRDPFSWMFFINVMVPKTAGVIKEINGEWFFRFLTSFLGYPCHSDCNDPKYWREHFTRSSGGLGGIAHGYTGSIALVDNNTASRFSAMLSIAQMAVSTYSELSNEINMQQRLLFQRASIDVTESITRVRHLRDVASLVCFELLPINVCDDAIDDDVYRGCFDRADGNELIQNLQLKIEDVHFVLTEKREEHQVGILFYISALTLSSVVLDSLNFSSYFSEVLKEFYITKALVAGIVVYSAYRVAKYVRARARKHRQAINHGLTTRVR